MPGQVTLRPSQRDGPHIALLLVALPATSQQQNTLGVCDAALIAMQPDTKNLAVG